MDHASGFKGNRGPKLAAAIAEATASAPSELWVWHTNRLGRGTGLPGEARAVGKLLYDLQAEGVTVRLVENDEFATNEMLWGIASKEASEYSKTLKANIKRGKKSAQERGAWPGGTPPDGLRLSPPTASRRSSGIWKKTPSAPRSCGACSSCGSTGWPTGRSRASSIRRATAAGTTCRGRGCR